MVPRRRRRRRHHTDFQKGFTKAGGHLVRTNSMAAGSMQEAEAHGKAHSRRGTA